jgi:hypothetical protein
MLRQSHLTARRTALAVAAAGIALLTGCSPTAPASASASATPTTATASAAAHSSAVAAGNGCRSLVVSDSVKADVTAAYRRSQPGLVHIAPVKGTFYYGECDGTAYAGTRFQATSGATLGEQVALQDEGGAMKYFSAPSGGDWRFVAGAGFPGDPRGCAVIPRIPAPLAAIWADCLGGR